MSQSSLPAIVIDTREQLPFEFAGIPTVRGTLATADYSLVGLEGRVGVERKSKSDAYQCCGSSRARFVRCLTRLAALDRACVVIECSLADFAHPPPRTRIEAAMAIGSFISWSCQYRIPVYWCGSRAFAERVTVRFLAAYAKHLAKAPD